MKHRYEVLSNFEEIPAKLFIENIGNTEYRCEAPLSLLFVIKGEVNVTLGNDSFPLREDDLLLINPYCVHLIESLNSNQIALLHLDGTYFNKLYPGFDKLIFKLNSTDNEENKSGDYSDIRTMLVKLLDTLVKKKNGYLLIANKLILDVVLCFISRFCDSMTEEAFADNQDEERINTIIHYVLIHYKEKISLTDIAAYLNLNPQYVSRYFSKHMGVTLNTFISKIRLQESLSDLCSKEKKITYIALEYGFPNLKSYFKAFRDHFNMTPSKYRSLYLNEIETNETTLHLSNEISYKAAEYPLNYLETRLEVKDTPVIDCNRNGEPLVKTWKKIMAFGRASEGMREELRNQLRMVQKDIPFEYVRFHGILSDEMMVYNEDSTGHVEYNFSYVDELIDFLLKNKLKPFLELGFMPEQLASEKIHLFFWKANISLPRNMEKWTNLIKSFATHLIERYGIQEVQTWYFELWNHSSMFSRLSDCFAFMKNTYHAIRTVNPKLKIGTSIGFTELEDFISYTQRETMVFDFISFTAYIISVNIQDQTKHELNELISVSDTQYIPQNLFKFCTYAEENHIGKTIDAFIHMLNKHNYKTPEIFISEWNSTPVPSDLLHDTCFKSAFLTKNIIENFDKVGGMAYWAFSDVFEETKTNHSTFHGGMGIITNNGIKKPGYYAYQFLNKLGNEMIARSDDYIVTRGPNASIQILAYHYCHFIVPDLKCEGNDITSEDRYHVFLEKTKEACFVIKGLKGKIIEKIYRINREKGSAYDTWLEIGAPKVMLYDEVNYIVSKSIYGYEIKEIYADGDLIIEERMQSHEVLFIELLPA